MSCWSRKEELSKKAKEHTEQMQKKYPNRIIHCIADSKIYGENGIQPVCIKSDILQSPEMIFVNTDSVSALFEYASGKSTILNYASYKNPGGMFIQGSSAQEECLCHESFLYNVLQNISDYYSWNKKHKNRALYLNRAIYETPQSTPAEPFRSAGGE